MASLRTCEYTPADRKPVDLVLVIDKSGSMQGEKMRLTKETAMLVAKELGASDRLSIISYDTNVVCSMPLSQMDAAGKTLASEAIDSIRPGSTTNLSGGLMRGLEELSNVSRPAETTSVLLLTDGLANCGIRDTKSIVSCLESILAARTTPCTVFTFGYGLDHDAAMLRAISDAGGGQYYDMEDGDAVASSFADCLGGLLSVVCENVRLRLECDGARITSVLSPGYQISSEAGALQVEVGDLYSEEFKDIVFEIALPAGDAAATVKVTLSYLDVVRTELVAADEVQTTLDRAEVASSELDVAVIDQINRIETVATIKQANDLAHTGRFSEGVALLDAAMTRLSLSPAKGSILTATLTADLAECRAGMQDAHVFRTTGSKDCHSMMQSHSKQRSNRVMKKRRASTTPPPGTGDAPLPPDSPYDTPSKRSIRVRWSPAAAATSAPSILQHIPADSRSSRESWLMLPPPTPTPQSQTSTTGAGLAQPSPVTMDEFVVVDVAEATPPDGAAARRQ